MKKFVLYYIILRFVFAAFYRFYPLPGIRATDLISVGFALILFYYYLEKRTSIHLKVVNYYTAVTVWITLSLVFSFLLLNTNLYSVLKEYFRFFSGYAIFLSFPLIFKTKKDLEQLVNAFLLSTIFPLLQFFGQMLLGPNLLGFRAQEISSDLYIFEGVYGNHGVFGLTAWWGLLALFMKFPQRKNKNLVFNLALFVYLIMGILTFSRTIIIIMIFIIFTFIFTNLRVKNFNAILMFLLLFVLLLNSSIIKDTVEGVASRSSGEMYILRGERGLNYALHGRVSRWQEKLDAFFEKDPVAQFVGTDIQLGPHGDFIFWLLRFGYIGLFLYILLLYKIFMYIKKVRFYVTDNSLKYYGTAIMVGMGVWIIMAIPTNPSMMPDFSLFVMGNASVFLALSRKDLLSNSQLAKNKIQENVENKNSSGR